LDTVAHTIKIEIKHYRQYIADLNILHLMLLKDNNIVIVMLSDGNDMRA